MKKIVACMAPLLLAALVCSGCSVSEMSTLRELSRPYTGVYACEKLTWAGRDLLEDFEYIRLELDRGGAAVFSWERRSGGKGEFSLGYDADVENGLVTFSSGSVRRTFPLGGGAVRMELIVLGRLLYAVFSA